MNKYNYEGPEQFKPISTWGYVGYGFLFCVPVIGWILLAVFAFSNNHINRRSYARSFFIRILILFIVFVGLVAMAHYDILHVLPGITSVIKQVDKWFPEKAGTSEKTTETEVIEEIISAVSSEADKTEKKDPAATVAPK